MKDDYRKKECSSNFLMGVITAMAVGGYFLFISKKAKRNRKKIDWWIEDISDEIFNKIKTVKNLTEEKFDEVADSVMEKYSLLKDIKDEKIKKIKKEARKKWEEAQEESEDEEDDE